MEEENRKREKVKKQKPAGQKGPAKESVCLTISIIATLFIAFVYYYLLLPPINIHAGSFWLMLIVLLVVFFVIQGFVRSLLIYSRLDLGMKEAFAGKMSKPGAFAIAGVAVIIVALFLCALIGSVVFRARKYASLITVNEHSFKEDMPETTEVTNIALMDTNSARIIGNRALGNLSEVVSQYELGESYSQINYKGAPQKVSVLEYNGFFKWMNNKNSGIPGYVMVDPVHNTAKYVELEKNLKYAQSAFFGDYLWRKLRFSYPTKIFGSAYFEIDEDGNPFYVVACMKPNAGLFGAKDVSEVIIFNPVDGTSKLYEVGDVPSWVDIVYNGDLACEKYNWYGELAGGFWNSIIGQKGCRKTTDDYGYLMFDDDVWYYTGVTSVLSDESNIGFILTNARTGEYRYYSIVGAEEFSAMSAAQGEVQEKGYTASFPSLINVADQASYICVLKDKSGLVKLYALVNVENYSLVATGETQAKAIAAYKRLLIDKGVVGADTEVIDVPDDENPGEETELKEVKVTAESIRFADISGNTWIYIKGSDGVLYKSKVADDESVMLMEEGAEYTLFTAEADEKGIVPFKEWKK